jgi:hypothetical protein
MSLPACQQRVLDTIESALQKREPRLASMFAMFTRLNTSEELPRTERLEARWWARHRHWRPAPTGGVARARGHPALALRPLFLIPVLIMLAASIVLLGITSSSPVCTPTGSPRGPVTSRSHSENCPSATGAPFSHGP